MNLALEALRLSRSRRPLLAGGASLFFLGLMLVGFYTYAQTETGGTAEFRYTFENESYFNGLTFAVYGFYFGSLLVLPIFVVTEGAAQIAGDTRSGAMGLFLLRPLSRPRLFISKFLLAAASAFLLVGAFIAFALLVGLVAVGWGDLNLYPGVLQMADRHQHLAQSEALGRFGLAWPAAALAMLPVLALSFWIASWARSPVHAVGVAVATYLILYVTSEIHFFRDLRPFLFTSELAYWRALFREEIDWPDLARNASKLLGFGSLFLALAYRRFRTREEVG